MSPEKKSAQPRPVLLVGLPGALATAVGKAIQDSPDFFLPILDQTATPVSLTGDKIKDRVINDRYVADYLASDAIYLARPTEHEAVIRQLKAEHGDQLLAINCANAGGFPVNSSLVRAAIPPIYAGTGVAPEKIKELETLVNSGEVSYLPTTNMALQIFQLMEILREHSRTHPNSMKDYSVEIIESHQQSKKDPSGTALKMAGYLQAAGMALDLKGLDSAGLDGTPRDITIPIGNNSTFRIVRDPEVQRSMGVPPEFIGDERGHGFHRYKFSTNGKDPGNLEDLFVNIALTLFTNNPLLKGYSPTSSSSRLSVSSPRKDVHLELNRLGGSGIELVHNVCGKDPYATGGLELLRYNGKQPRGPGQGRVNSTGNYLKDIGAKISS